MISRQDLLGLYSLCVQDDSDGMVLLGASMPALGLSNKAVLLEEQRETKQVTASESSADQGPLFTPVELTGTHTHTCCIMY